MRKKPAGFNSLNNAPKARPRTGKLRRCVPGNSSSLYPVPTQAEPSLANTRVAIRLANLLRGTIGI